MSEFNFLFDQLVTGEKILSVIGLGYVGLPIAVAFSKKVKTIGFDINNLKIEQYKKGIDPTKEVGDKAIRKCKVEFTTDPSRLCDASFHIVAVPTPIYKDKTPNLNPLKSASITLGRNLSRGSVVVYESTVYPGVTEEICVPILEHESGLRCGMDFKVGYSPERINPGDMTHRINNITKIVSGMDDETLEVVGGVYQLIVDAGVYFAENIRVAEAAKVIENSQRDINVAFMNELSIIFNRMGIDTKAVLAAAATKWNFLRFAPGLVGGHCIGVDPYYLTYRAEQMGYHSQIILAGRKINDGMGKYVAENIVKSIIKAKIPVAEAKVAFLGFTFKENCPDTRNTRVIDIVNELIEYEITPIITDPIADKDEAFTEYGVLLHSYHEIKEMDVIVIAVGHNTYTKLTITEFNSFFKGNGKKRVVIDVKGILDKELLENEGYIYWRL